MLISFSVENFRSFKDKAILSMCSSSISEHEGKNTFKWKKLSLIKTAAIYGHNASGKSNLLNALVFMRWFVIGSSKDTQIKEEIEVEPFLLSSETEEKPSIFEIVFAIDDVKYRYGFSTTRKEIRKEWLLYSTKNKEYPLFLRQNEKFQIDEKFKEAKGIENRTRPNALFLSVSAQFNVECAEKILDWFYSIHAVHGLNDIEYQDITLNLLKEKKDSTRIKQLMKRADFGIEDILSENAKLDIEEVLKSVPKELHEFFKDKLDDDQDIVNINTMHKKFDGRKRQIDTVSFPFDKKESQGTQKFFNLIGVFVEAIKNNSVVIIDEFDTRLHPILVKTVINLFNSSKIHSTAQLILTTHYTSLLDKDLLRRDQIYFVEKDYFGSSNLYSMIEFKTRKGSAFEKNYYNGKFGALPTIGDIEELFVSTDLELSKK